MSAQSSDYCAALNTITPGWSAAVRRPVFGSIAMAAKVPRNPAAVVTGTSVTFTCAAFNDAMRGAAQRFCRKAPALA